MAAAEIDGQGIQHRGQLRDEAFDGLAGALRTLAQALMSPESGY